MAVERQQNWLGGQRADVPHFRALESAITADFDLLAGTILAGRKPLVVNGFQLITTGVTLATSLQLSVAGSALVHFYASESGSIFQVPTDRAVEILNSTNPRVSGSFTPSVMNFVGLDLVRSADATTSDLVEFIDTVTLTETPETVPLARTLDYRIVISTNDFDASPGVAPIATVQVDATGSIVQVEDARNIFWRLGTGGTVPNPLNTYPWPNGRKEGVVTADFTGGDKAITSLKSWMDAVSTRLWELGGGEYWYSAVSDHNVVMARTGTPFVSDGEFFEWSGTNLHWKGLSITFGNSTGIYNTITDVTSDTPGLTDLAAGECIYVDIDRTQNATLNAVKTTLAVLGSPDVPGSRWILAWRFGSNILVRDQSYPVGSAFKLATTTAAGSVEVSATDGASVTPVKVATTDSVTFAAYASGITRGSDFFGGAGDITIGGYGTYDHNVILSTFRDQDEVTVTGSHNYATGQAASLHAHNSHDLTTGAQTDLVARFSAHNGGTSQDEDVLHIDSCGAIGLRIAAVTPSAPAPTSTRPIRAKLFLQTNFVSSPNKRDQLYIQWADGTATLIAESNRY